MLINNMLIEKFHSVKFHSNINSTFKDLGLDLGSTPCLLMCDNVFSNSDCPVQDLGESYIIFDNETTVRLYPKTSSVVAISQVIMYIDFTFNFEKIGILYPNLYKSFTVHNKTFTALTVEAIELIKTADIVYLEINTPNVGVEQLFYVQAVFHAPENEPDFNSEYQERCILLRRRLNI